MDHVLYFVGHPSRGAASSAQAALEATARRVSPVRARGVVVSTETSVVRALARLRSGGADALVLDARGEPFGIEESPSLALMRSLFDEHEVGGAIARDHTLVVVDEDARGAELSFEAGKLRLGGAVAGHADRGLFEAVWERVVNVLSMGRGGKIALCLAGGGTEGLFYELGVLRALSRFLPDYPLADVDILCGISAGAVLGAMLANGVGPEELAAGLRGKPSRIDRIRRSDLFDPNLGALARRASTLGWQLASGRRSPLSALFRLPPAGVFAGARLRAWLERQLTKPGMVNRFEDLPRKLFIGATDQDRNEHVVFGAPGAPKVPIHVAVRASTALVPFYAPEIVGDRYYVDGGFTRTTNMRVAVQEGATLVILVDPLVPVSSGRAGHVAERGGVFVAMQGLKSLINGRFDKAVPTLRAMYPQVAFHLFQPGEATRRVMGGSPMKYFFRQEIEEIAFRETMRDIRARRSAQLARDFERHGVSFVDPDDGARRSREVEAADVRVVA
jgi:predicted acylesterase/phospholipase RssA